MPDRKVKQDPAKNSAQKLRTGPIFCLALNLIVAAAVFQKDAEFVIVPLRKGALKLRQVCGCFFHFCPLFCKMLIPHRCCNLQARDNLGVRGTGSSLWEASVVLTSYMDVNPSSLRDKVRSIPLKTKKATYMPIF
jgi:hypothetical protein